jgi:hypothetical protein
MMNPLALLGCASVLVLAAFAGGWKVASDHYAAQAVKTLVKTVVVTQKIGETAQQAATQAQATRDHIVYRTQTIHDQIPVYLGSDAYQRVPAGFVRLYNDSLGLSADAGPAGGPGASAGSVRPDSELPTLATASGPIVTNNGSCVALTAQVNGLIDFYGQVRGLVNGPAH